MSNFKYKIGDIVIIVDHLSLKSIIGKKATIIQIDKKDKNDPYLIELEEVNNNKYCMVISDLYPKAIKKYTNRANLGWVSDYELKRINSKNIRKLIKKYIDK